MIQSPIYPGQPDALLETQDWRSLSYRDAR
jgi:hypothetical protein